MTYKVVGQRVFDMVDEYAPQDVWDEFYLMLETLASEGPYPEDHPDLELGILKVQEPTLPNSFTVPFDNGLLWYQVMKDQPVVKLVDAFWQDED